MPKIGESGAICCEASLWGHMLFSIELGPLTDQMAPVRMLTERNINHRPWLCWKYIPSLEGPPDADYALAVVNELQLDKLSSAHHGRLQLGDAPFSSISLLRPLLDALATLRPTGPAQGFHMAGSNRMRLDRSRRLR